MKLSWKHQIYYVENDVCTRNETDLDRGRGHQRRRENSVLCPCMDMPRHFDVIFMSSLTSANYRYIAFIWMRNRPVYCCLAIWNLKFCNGFFWIMKFLCGNFWSMRAVNANQRLSFPCSTFLNFCLKYKYCRISGLQISKMFRGLCKTYTPSNKSGQIRPCFLNIYLGGKGVPPAPA